ncbi:hypothetical protein [Symmachiella dynata]|uniref:hypothetical protein n=1 Tax=Symmachiella dynata TaxID=2527995 RepID=UPI0030ECD191|tara:strand:- start:564 stop:926 length:363 start_codon:yes stop_codon:yes gene_type:complete
MNTLPAVEASQPLFVVEHALKIKGRGLALIGFTADQHGLFAKGQLLELTRPDGTDRLVRVLGAEYPPSVELPDPPPETPRYGLLVGPKIGISHVPPGTEVRFAAGQEPAKRIQFSLPDAD